MDRLVPDRPVVRQVFQENLMPLDPGVFFSEGKDVAALPFTLEALPDGVLA